MKAVVIRQAGGPEVLSLEDRPMPSPRPGWVLIRVRAFGLNRSELFTRRGHSPNVRFPRILGIEAVGEVVEAPAGGFAPGDKVATAMGGMGRAFDGGYAEYTLVPASQVQKVETGLDWATLGALPEMADGVWLTAYLPSAASGADVADPRWDDLGWVDCGHSGQKAWRDRDRHNA
jgi:NADPH:quinone reductase-like Zn-dependent oxidoreductase